MLSANISDEKARAKLLELAVEGDRDDKVMIAYWSFHLARKHKAFCLELVKLCSQSDDPHILDNLQLSMGSIAPDFPVECLEIIQKWFRNDSLRNRINLGDVPEQIEKGDRERVDVFLLRWIAEEHDRRVLGFELPKLIDDMFARRDKDRLLQILRKIDITREEGLVACAEIIKHMLSSLDGKLLDQTFIRGCYDLACKIAQCKNVDYTSIKIDNDNEMLLTLAILSEARRMKKQIDFSEVLPNLGRYPNIQRILGNNWFEDKISSKDEKQPLILLLARSKPKEEEINEQTEALKNSADDLMWLWTIHSLRSKLEPHALLDQIDRSIMIFCQDEQPKFARVKKGLTNPDEFYPTVAELVFAAHLRTCYPVEMQFKVNSRTVDCKANIDGRGVLIEVINPDMALELKYLRTIAGQGENRAKEKIEDKLEEQIPEMASNNTMPIIIAMNSGRSGIDDIEVSEALYGSLQIKIDIDNKTSKVIKAKPSRANDGIYKNAAGKFVSAVILYRSEFDFSDCKMKLVGDIHKTLNSERPITDELLEKIKRAIFNTALP